MIGQTISHYPALGDSAFKRDSSPAVRDATFSSSFCGGKSGTKSSRSWARAMGMVYKTHDIKLDRLAALEFLPSELIIDSGAKT